MRIGLASIMQETNTFSITPCGWEDFTTFEGWDAADRLGGTNSEFGGALEMLGALGLEPVPLLYAWALPSGRVTRGTFQRLLVRLRANLANAGPLDGLVLSLHGAMATDDVDDADLALIDACREGVGRIPIAVCLDLHANVTVGMIEAADLLTGYRTDPHVDMAETGRRITRMLSATLNGRLTPTAALAKRPLIVPAEAMNTSTGALAEVRRIADDIDVADASIFPVQPWLDVAEHGLAVVVTTDGDHAAAVAAAELLAGEVWDRRHRFGGQSLTSPEEAYRLAQASSVRPFVMAESADAPTAGAAGDSPAMVKAALKFGAGLKTLLTIVDPPVVALCFDSEPAAKITTQVGATVDNRWWRPVEVEGTISRVGAGRFRLDGVGYHGLEASMGRWAVIEAPGLTMLVTERPAISADPSCFRHAGLDPFATDVLVVKSCSDFRPNYPDSAPDAVTLDVPGAATPRLDRLEFTQGQRWIAPSS